jgi:hypothetical protein
MLIPTMGTSKTLNVICDLWFSITGWARKSYEVIHYTNLNFLFSIDTQYLRVNFDNKIMAVI